MAREALPTVMLIEGSMYWVMPRHNTPADRWTVAKWEVGCFWGIDGGEVSPSVICGPIPHPTENDASDGALGRQGNLPPDTPNPSSPALPEHRGDE